MEVRTNSKASSDFGASITDFMKSSYSLIEEVILQISDFTVYVTFMKEEFHNRPKSMTLNTYYSNA
jgi:hypothetical protein